VITKNSGAWVARTAMEDGVIVEQHVYHNRDLCAYHISPSVAYAVSLDVKVIFGKCMEDIIDTRQSDGRRVLHSNIRKMMELI